MPSTNHQRPLYNRIAGQSLERIGALSDGIFAIAMTLMVLEIHVPSPGGVNGEAELLTKLSELGPEFVSFGLSFLTLGIFWTGQQTQLSQFARADRDLAWIYFAFLAAVSLLPFSTRLLADFIMFRTALVIYWLNIAVLGGLLYGSWRSAEASGLIKQDAPPETSAAVRHRIVIAQGLYAASTALCFIDTRVSIALIVLIQLNYALAPRRGWIRGTPR